MFLTNIKAEETLIIERSSDGKSMRDATNKDDDAQSDNCTTKTMSEAPKKATNGVTSPVLNSQTQSVAARVGLISI